MSGYAIAKRSWGKNQYCLYEYNSKGEVRLVWRSWVRNDRIGKQGTKFWLPKEDIHNSDVWTILNKDYVYKNAIALAKLMAGVV